MPYGEIIANTSCTALAQARLIMSFNRLALGAASISLNTLSSSIWFGEHD